MANGYTLRNDGYTNGIGRGDEYLKGVLNSTDTAGHFKLAVVVLVEKSQRNVTVPSAMKIRDRDGGGDLIARISGHDRGDVPGNPWNIRYQ